MTATNHPNENSFHLPGHKTMHTETIEELEAKEEPPSAHFWLNSWKTFYLVYNFSEFQSFDKL